MHPLIVSVLLFDTFSNMVLACLLEPLRVVRDQTGVKIDWTILTEGDRAVVSSSGLNISPECRARDARPAELVLLIGGDTFRNARGASLRRFLTQQMRDATVIAADTGAWILARAGLLDDRRATVHWQLLDEFAEEFPSVRVLSERHVRDGRIWTCGSAAAGFDLMLDFIRERFGAAIAFDAGAMFLHDNARRHGASYPGQVLARTVSPKLQQVIAQMAQAIEDPQPIPSLADRAHLSERALYRLFNAELNITPARYYLLLRLARARELLRYSGLSANDIATRCGFANATTLSRSLLRCTGTGLNEVVREGR